MPLSRPRRTWRVRLTLLAVSALAATAPHVPASSRAAPDGPPRPAAVVTADSPRPAVASPHDKPVWPAPDGEPERYNAGSAEGGS
ncbi:hypothetical protein [Streptantibioticus cattleyicolor]|uniref:Uncharacterized protein n=1 Tax=Streptantibioticus cattleyicolor (strain ATCC 35852 / DSM 46488 / JCM 4925 / NBRC 14057 / NRRL 8057) TaxID=1003195 RepID=F8JM56_STREN|nr:hypothetical protein [Streptantibioticus cattleyicolor]AEW99420.1 hypothetical protein SCATT_p12270 [Streptantibioticus cattleyicolor NRRL 8057 = DSM 46488]CCB71540.1 exported protein of unknown function [Streptantibioticus cattleyicolor NRRL 8057 = DSM 46488]